MPQAIAPQRHPAEQLKNIAKKFSQARNGRLWHERELGASRVPSAKNHSQTYNEVPDGAFFLFVSKGFSNCDRPSETG